ncbi:MAG: DUF2796 domain-containing protein [Pseudomonadales bacterium]|nr:DUF2796 domain-containing protein [Pseudomonadales bacterium]
MYSATTIIAVLSMLSIALNAEPLDHDDHHQQEAHLHGLVEMTLAIEGNTMELNLESPAANIVGFEHPVSTPEQHASVTRAKTILDMPEQLLTFIGTRCQSLSQDMNLSAVLQPAETHQNAEAHSAHQEHTDKNHEEHDDHQTHSEISVRYQFHCAQGTKLTAIKVHLFDLFPRIETVQAAWVSHSNQASAILTTDSITINLEAR